MRKGANTKHFVIRTLIVILLALVIYFGLILISGISMRHEEKRSGTQTFHGPTGAPYIKGPTSSPPQN